MDDDGLIVDESRIVNEGLIVEPVVLTNSLAFKRFFDKFKFCGQTLTGNSLLCRRPPLGLHTLVSTTGMPEYRLQEITIN